MEYSTTIGVDVSDRTSKICVMTKTPEGERRIVVLVTHEHIFLRVSHAQYGQERFFGPLR